MKNILRVAMLKKSPKNIVCIDAYDVLNLLQIKKIDFLASYLKHKDLFVGRIEILSDLSNEETARAIAVKTYEDFNLKHGDKCKIIYKETIKNDKNRAFIVFVVKNDDIEKIFSKTLSKTPYIDYIVATPLFFKPLYEKKVLSPVGIDGFLFFQSDDAFIAIYKNGEFLQSRPIRYTLNTLYKKFSSTTKNGIPYIDFLQIIKTGDENLEQIITEIAYYINDVLNSIIRIYNFNIVDNIFISGEIEIKNLAENIQKNLNIKTQNLIIDNLHSSTRPIDLLKLAAKSYLDNGDDFNFSIFQRPPFLLKRHCGLLILSGITAAAFTLSVPLYKTFEAYLLKNENKIIEAKLDEIKTNNQELELKFQVSQEAESELKKSLEMQLNKSANSEKLLYDMVEKKDNYIIKSIILYDLANKAFQKNIQILDIQNIDKNVTLLLKSSNEKILTEFFTDAVDSGYSVYTENIAYKDASYQSTVTLGVR